MCSPKTEDAFPFDAHAYFSQPCSEKKQNFPLAGNLIENKKEILYVEIVNITW